MDSRQVAWFETYTYAERLAAGYGINLDHHLIPGTPQWCGMPDDDARKLLALLFGGVREALTNSAYQDSIEQAGQDIWEGADWSAAARNLLRRREIDDMRRSA